jgi:hypothetical protein
MDNLKFYKAIGAATTLLEDPSGMEQSEIAAIKASLKVAKAGLKSTFSSLKTLNVDDAYGPDNDSKGPSFETKVNRYLYLYMPLPPKELADRVGSAIDSVGSGLAALIEKLKAKLLTLEEFRKFVIPSLMFLLAQYFSISIWATRPT